MAARPDHGAPYATACLIYGLAEQPQYRSYVRGKLALAGIDSRVPAATWLDALYAIVADAPLELLEKMDDQLTIYTGRLRPDRETWGMSPGQIRLSQKLTGGRKP